MSSEQYATTDPSQEPGGPPRRRWWLAALSAVIVGIALVSGVVGLTGDDSDEVAGDPERSPSASSEPSTAPEEEPSTNSDGSGQDDAREEPTGDPDKAGGGSDSLRKKQADMTLSVPAQAGRCLVPKPSTLREWPLAFEATVKKVDAGQGLALLQVDRWYAAEGFGGMNTIMVEQPDAIRESQLTLESGETYLIAAGQNASVAVCGFSGPKSPEMTSLYRRAFE